MAPKKKLTEHYNTAKALFDKTTTMMNLRYKDIALMTTGASELKLFKELRNHTLNPHFGQDPYTNRVTLLPVPPQYSSF